MHARVKQTGKLPLSPRWSLPKICLSILTDGVITGSLRRAGILVYAAPVSGISTGQLRVWIFNKWPKRVCVCACPCRDVHSQLRWGRLLQESAVWPEPRGVLVRRPAWWRDDGLQNPWQPRMRWERGVGGAFGKHIFLTVYTAGKSPSNEVILCL